MLFSAPWKRRSKPRVNRPVNMGLVRTCAAELMAIAKRMESSGIYPVMFEQIIQLRKTLDGELSYADPSTMLGKDLEIFLLKIFKIRRGPADEMAAFIKEITEPMLNYGLEPIPPRVASLSTVGDLAHA